MSETPQLPYRLGEPDIECRYPVLVGTWFIGHALRWHGVWYAVPAGTTTDVRVADGGPRRGGGSPAAAAWLYSEFTEGRITPQSVVDSAAATLVKPETVPLLHPRMPETARNIASARTAFAGLEAHRWTPYGGYPGSDNLGSWSASCADGRARATGRTSGDATASRPPSSATTEDASEPTRSARRSAPTSGS
ncbi:MULTISPECIES: hypothetical protein [unclassified Streptomyces]|uniref:hypothetical protein n=1 Tax=unclassified Streptomyces TaxID=2593676 RepID=UPI002E34E611|nr:MULTISPECIES: hypothetical protein [unclassified Streptomyces]